MIDIDPTTSSQLYYALALCTVYWSANSREQLVHKVSDRLPFNLLVTPIIHVCFFGLSSFMHNLASAFMVYLLYHGGGSKIGISILMMSHLLYTIHSFELEHYLAPTAQMMIMQRATYYMHQVKSASAQIDEHVEHDNQEEIIRETAATSMDEDLNTFLSYMFEPAGYFSGPVISFREFNDVVTRPKVDRVQIKQLMSQTSMHVVSMLLCNRFLPTLTMEGTSMQVVAHVFAMTLAARFKYYAVWTLSEATCALYGYPKDRQQSVDIQAITTATTTSKVVRNWNRGTQRFLYECIYSPLREASWSKLSATLFTFAYSARWHGSSPRYLCAMIPLAIVNILQSSKNSHRLSHGIEDVVSIGVVSSFNTLLTQLFIGHLLGPFLLEDMSQIVMYIQKTWFMYVLSIVYALYA